MVAFGARFTLIAHPEELSYVRLGAQEVVPEWALTDAPLVSVGALNPSGQSVALFSNIGPWVQAYAPGAAVVSTSPAFVGGTQAATRADVEGLRRETIDPDDYRGGFAVWSGTSFSTPLVAGLVARLVLRPV